LADNNVADAFSIIDKLVDAYGGGIALLGAIFYFIYISYLKITPGRESKELIDMLFSRVKHLENDVKDLSAKLDRQNDIITELKVKNTELIIRLDTMESAHIDSPLPQWIKDLNSVMVSVNSSYEEHFLKPLGKTASAYIGKNDVDMWGKEVGENFVKHDAVVVRNRKVWYGIENVPQKDGSSIPHLIVKYPRYSGNTLIGIAGIAIPSYMSEKLTEVSNGS